MGCINACICSGNCLRCNSYKAEEYVGHAEDLYDYLYGRQEQQAYDDWARKQEEAYYEEMYAKYEQEMQEMFEGGNILKRATKDLRRNAKAKRKCRTAKL